MFSIGEVYLPEEPSPTAAPWPFPFQWLRVVGRLKPGITREQAGAEATVIARRDPALNTDECAQQGRPAPGAIDGLLSEWRVGPFLAVPRRGWLLYVIACSNAASLMLARAVARRRRVGRETGHGRESAGRSHGCCWRKALCSRWRRGWRAGDCVVGAIRPPRSCSPSGTFHSIGPRPPLRWRRASQPADSSCSCGQSVAARTLERSLQEGSGALGDSRRLKARASGIRRGAGSAGGRVVGRSRK